MQRLDLATWNRPIDGVKAISAHCTEYAGVEISVHQIRRLIQRKRNPLPAIGIGGERKRWIVRDLVRFGDWMRGEYGM